MAIKAISQFDAATPTSNDKILFEQNGEGKSATLAELPIPTKVQGKLDTKVNTSNVLTLEEIQATTDLAGKVASAKALHDSLSMFGYHDAGSSLSFKVPANFMLFIAGDGNSHYFLGLVGGYTVKTLTSDNSFESNIRLNSENGILTLPSDSWYYYSIIK